MKEPEKKRLRLFLIFFIVSLILHFGLAIFFYQIHEPRIAQGPELASPQEVVFIKPEDLIPAPPVVDASQLELADIAKPKVEKVPQKARFKSQYNSAVPQETTATRIPPKARFDAETAGEGGKKGDQADLPGPKPKEPPRLAMKDKLEGKPAEPSPEKEISLKDLELKPADFKDLIKEAQDKAPKKEKQVAATQSPDLKDLTSLPRLGKPGLPGEEDHFAHDFLPNIKIGDKTYVNALAFPDVQYFTRLKRTFRMRFNPVPPLQTYLAGNRIVVGKVNVTMAVTVSSGGQLQELFVVKSSGIPGYDDEALRTVRQSAPFSAPPTKILDKDGTLRMTWNFITYL